MKKPTERYEVEVVGLETLFSYKIRKFDNSYNTNKLFLYYYHNLVLIETNILMDNNILGKLFAPIVSFGNFQRAVKPTKSENSFGSQ